ncbi:MAG: DUF1080 domain-containing protein [Planctomycetota bacterium]
MFQAVSVSVLSFCCFLPLQENESDYKIQGEYSGVIEVVAEQKIGLQVIALGKGKFSAKLFRDGLPGDGWNQKDSLTIDEREINDGVLVFTNDVGANIAIKDGVATVSKDDEVVGSLQRVVRESPTLGEQAPEGAVVLFGDGKDKESMMQFAKLWKTKKNESGNISDEGWLMQGVTSKQTFGDHKIHIEFQLPFQPGKRGQARGNSGLYLQGRYEVQMLDSFGLTGEQNECGGIYSIRKPDFNMCFPPLQWQTYDIEFYQAKYDGDRVVKSAMMTVKHNGVVVHDKVELPKTTTAAPKKMDSAPGPVYLQDHGNPVRYRNIWVMPLQEQATEGQAKPDGV